MGKDSWPSWLRRRPAPLLLDLQDFREHVAAAIAKRYPLAEIDQFGDDGLWVAPQKARPAFTLNVARFHALYCDAPRDRERLVTQLAATIERKESPATRESLRVLVRPDTYLTGASIAEDRQICRHIAGNLWAIVVSDEEDAIGFPPAAMLRADLAMDDRAIWEQALTNSRRLLPAIHLPGSNSVQVFAGDDGHAVSALADDSLWDRFDAEAPDGYLVMPLEIHVLCICGSFSPNAAPILREFAAISEASPDHLSSMPLTRRDGRWVEAAEIDAAFARRGFEH